MHASQASAANGKAEVSMKIRICCVRVRMYQNMCFTFSCHVLTTAGRRLDHHRPGVPGLGEGQTSAGKLNQYMGQTQNC